jgi:hypothetical protein
VVAVLLGDPRGGRSTRVDYAPRVRDWFIEWWAYFGGQFGLFFAWLSYHLTRLLDALGPAVKQTFKSMFKTAASPFYVMWETLVGAWWSLCEFCLGLARTLSDKAYTAYSVTPAWLFVVCISIVIALIWWWMNRRGWIAAVVRLHPAAPGA